MSSNPAPAPAWPGVIRRYARFLPVTAETPVVTLLEGNTPLIPVPNFVAAIGGAFDLRLKYEAMNPTCSFKDRGMTMAITKAKERGATTVVCASTGNTSASAAAYAARAGLKCVVLLPQGKIAHGKMSQALLYGATTVSIEGNFDDALNIVRELGPNPPGTEATAPASGAGDAGDILRRMVLIAQRSRALVRPKSTARPTPATNRPR